MTDEISPCQTPAVVTPNGHDRRRDGPPPRRQRQPTPSAPPRGGEAALAEIPDPASLPYKGTRIDIRV